MNAIDLKGRIAIVTGGARGIGFAIAQRMLRSGAQVALWDIDAAAMNEAARPLQDSGVVYIRAVDVTDEFVRGCRDRFAHAYLGQGRYPGERRRHHRR